MDVPRAGDEWMGFPSHFLWLMLWRFSRIKIINLREVLKCSQVLFLGVSKPLIHRAFVECIHEKDVFIYDYVSSVSLCMHFNFPFLILPFLNKPKSAYVSPVMVTPENCSILSLFLELCKRIVKCEKADKICFAH